MKQTPSSCPGPLSRRSFLQVGSLGLGALGMGDLMRLRAEAKPVGATELDTSIIFIWLPAGQTESSAENERMR